MTRAEYIDKVTTVLNQHSKRASSNLEAALPLVPPKARSMRIEIFVDQDEEGFLSVHIALNGPELIVLNRAIATHAMLFDTIMKESGFEPALPLMEPGRESFSVADALTDCAALWVTSLWKHTSKGAFALPVTVVSHGDYGTKLPIHLSR